jgi:cytochrome c-type biogenesis protein CcmF
LIAYTFSAFVLATIVVELVRGTRALGSVFTLIARNRRRYGGYVVHAAIVLLAIGIAGSSAYGATTRRELLPGQTMRFHGYRLTYTHLTRIRTPQGLETRAVMLVRGRWNGTLTTGHNDYNFPPETDQRVGIETDWLRAEDLYVITNFRTDGSTYPGGGIYFQVLVKPLVNLIWVAGIVFLIGSGVAMWPDARGQRRLVTRLAPARAPA